MCNHFSAPINYPTILCHTQYCAIIINETFIPKVPVCSPIMSNIYVCAKLGMFNLFYFCSIIHCFCLESVYNIIFPIFLQYLPHCLNGKWVNFVDRHSFSSIHFFNLILLTWIIFTYLCCLFFMITCITNFKNPIFICFLLLFLSQKTLSFR